MVEKFTEFLTILSLILVFQQIDGVVSSIKSFNEASIDEDFHNINEASIKEDGQHNSNDLNLLIDPLDDPFYEEKHPIDLTKKLKDLGNRITSFFIGDNERSGDESSQIFSEPTSSPSLVDSNIGSNANANSPESPHMAYEVRSSFQQNLPESNKNINLQHVNSELRAGDLNYKKNINGAILRQEESNSHNLDRYESPEKSNSHNRDRYESPEKSNAHNRDRYASPEGTQVDKGDIENADAYINAMPLLKNYLNFNSQMKPQRESDLRRIQAFLNSANTQIMNGSLPRFSGDFRLLDTFGRKLKDYKQ